MLCGDSPLIKFLAAKNKQLIHSNVWKSFFFFLFNKPFIGVTEYALVPPNMGTVLLGLTGVVFVAITDAVYGE